MAPATPAADDSHQQLLDALDMTPISKPFRTTTWKPSLRRNKNLKQIISENSRKEASQIATQNNSGASTPYVPASTGVTDGALTPAYQNGISRPPNIAQAAQSLSNLVLEKNLRAALQPTGPAVTYTNIESAPSLHPAHQKHYCDITGLAAPYTDPKTRLRYHNKEIFGVVRSLGQGTAERYLEARGAHVVLK
jgi:INO80 complex subunit C